MGVREAVQRTEFDCEFDSWHSTASQVFLPLVTLPQAAPHTVGPVSSITLGNQMLSRQALKDTEFSQAWSQAHFLDTSHPLIPATKCKSGGQGCGSLQPCLCEDPGCTSRRKWSVLKQVEAAPETGLSPAGECGRDNSLEQRTSPSSDQILAAQDVRVWTYWSVSTREHLAEGMVWAPSRTWFGMNSWQKQWCSWWPHGRVLRNIPRAINSTLNREHFCFLNHRQRHDMYNWCNALCQRNLLYANMSC